MYKILYLFLFLIHLQGYSFERVSKAPIAFAYDPTKSHLPQSSKSPDILYAGERPRYSACSGVVWLPGDKYLLSVHLFGATISTYEFDEDSHTLTPIKCLGNADGLSLDHPENLDVSPDGIWIAISQGRGTTDFFVLDIEDQPIYQTPISLRYSNIDWTHGAAFSNDGIFLASTSIGGSSCICIYKCINGEFKMHQILENQIRPLEPKGVAFSPDNSFLAACYCQTIGTNQTTDPKAQIEIYRLDPTTELFDPNPVSLFKQIPGNMETIKFSKDGSYLVSSDQVFDKIYLHPFDPSTGLLSDSEILLENPSAQLSFPHGIAFSHDGRYLAVTNYGDDRITIYKINTDRF